MRDWWLARARRRTKMAVNAGLVACPSQTTDKNGRQCGTSGRAGVGRAGGNGRKRGCARAWRRERCRVSGMTASVQRPLRAWPQAGAVKGRRQPSSDRGRPRFQPLTDGMPHPNPASCTVRSIFVHGLAISLAPCIIEINFRPGRILPGGSGRGIRRWPGRSRNGLSRGGSGTR